MALLPSTWKDKTFASNLDDETHIWAIELRQSPEYQSQLFKWLSDKEKDKVNRILISLKRDYQIQAKAWLRWLLTLYTESTPEKINYRYGPLGKPYLQSENDNIFFNATDSGTTLLCAFSKNNELGIDVESMPRKVKYQRIAEKKFTEQEQAALNAVPLSSQSNAFLALWTRKEAFGKALGVGIRYRMNQFNLCNDLKSYKHNIKDEQQCDWNLFQFIYENNIACLTTSQSHEKNEFYRLDLDSLVL